MFTKILKSYSCEIKIILACTFGSNSIIFDFITDCVYLLSIFSYKNDSLPQEYHVFLYTFNHRKVFPSLRHLIHYKSVYQ